MRGDWSFNPEYVMGISFAGLPLEEVLFVIFVLYSLLLLYEQAAYIFKDRTVPWKQGAGYATGMILILVSFLFIGKNYTFMAIFFRGYSIPGNVALLQGYHGASCLLGLPYFRIPAVHPVQLFSDITAGSDL